ncbi:hypothetical protein [Scytonema millei]|uniref:Uncharacterized protein n=1 Tax=Scytonema millei VB511283 TaxID=1245923 RepID=A0A9X5I5V4_9CYAN|nr:hypothetical protein [Scytonema millei]NHC36898.1 hypothetical protein [Scytonema millei VB511283]
MRIENPRYVLNQGHPELHFELLGRTAQLSTETKPTLNKAGIVSLGSDFDDLVPPIELNGTVLRGCTNNPEIFRLYDQFGHAVMNRTFKPGAIEYPPAR